MGHPPAAGDDRQRHNGWNGAAAPVPASSPRPLASIVIPAHNEARVIGRLLSGLLAGAEVGELEVIVVCNGCSDDTARRAEKFGPAVRVVETPVASKTHALNLGDGLARGFPRFYVDADVIFPRAALRRVCEVLRGGEVLAAAPRPEIDFTDRGWPIRAFYGTWLQLPYVRQDILGSGVYAVSEAGRRRFERFPMLIADDAFVRLQFAPHERRIVSECSSLVVPPRTLRALLRIKTRAHLGNLELRREFPELIRNELPAKGHALLRLAADPRRLPGLLVYGLVRIAARACSRSGPLRSGSGGWERDETSRGASSPGR